MSQLYSKLFAPLLSRLEDAKRYYGLGILIASCIGTRVRMGFLYRKAILGVFDHARLSIRDATPVAPSPTLIITPDQTEGVRKRPLAPHFAKAAPPRLHWRRLPVQPICHQSFRREDSRPADGWPLFGSPQSFKDVAGRSSRGNVSVVFDLLQFPEAITATFDSDSRPGSDASRSAGSRSSVSSPHSSKATVGTMLTETELEGDSLYAPPEPLATPPPLPSSFPSRPLGLVASSSSQDSVPSSLALSDTSDTAHPRPATPTPYNPNPDRYPDEVTSPANNIYAMVAMSGAGSYAYIMTAVRPHRADVVAVKVVHKRMAFRKGDDQVSCWEMEKYCLQLAREHKIPNWVYLLESWHDLINVYFAMEMAYGTLRDRLTGDHDHIEAKLWCREMLLAVKALRDHRIVHSDIKPDNFLIVRGGAVVLSDFGLAQTPEPPLPTLNAFLKWRAFPGGTPGYLAPEALQPRNAFVAHASDIFSLGVVFVELLGRMDELLWDILQVPRGFPGGSDAWFAMHSGSRQLWLMNNCWLKGIDIPEESLEWDLCEKMLYRQASVDELLQDPYFEELLDDEGDVKFHHTVSPRMSRFRIERHNRDLTFEAWYRPGGPGSYGPESASFGPLMDGSKVVKSMWLKDDESTKCQLQDPLPSDFNWVWQPSPPEPEEESSDVIATPHESFGPDDVSRISPLPHGASTTWPRLQPVP
ncbi:kinase-like domain-containing protein [Ganoderma leucocontextum]|nr:kinase-like domain-containing protein [Ganoderma leucocontextum]